MSLLLNISFEDNIRPEEVTPEVRRLLMRRERRMQITSTLFGILLLSFPIWFPWLLGSRSTTTAAMSRELFLLEVGLGLSAVMFVLTVSVPRIRLVQDGAVSKGVILDVERSATHGKERNTVKVAFAGACASWARLSGKPDGCGAAGHALPRVSRGERSRTRIRSTLVWQPDSLWCFPIGLQTLINVLGFIKHICKRVIDRSSSAPQ